MQLPDSFTGLIALDVAVRRGVIARLTRSPVPALEIEPILRGLLADAGVIGFRGADAVLAEPFAQDWAGRLDDLAVRTEFIRTTAADVALGLEDLCHDLPRFMARSRTFGLFRYDRAMGTSPVALQDTRAWTAYVEALTREEAPILAASIPLEGVEHLLEVGGNTGLFAEALLARHPTLQATVLDLPAVCALGRMRPDRAERLSFAVGDARNGNWAEAVGAFDAVLFKSVLHDWPDDQARHMVDTAVRALPARGRVIVCERGAWASEAGRRTSAANLANLVFAPFYRDPETYEGWFRDLGCTVQRQTISSLDMAFHVLTACIGDAG